MSRSGFTPGFSPITPSALDHKRTVHTRDRSEISAAVHQTASPQERETRPSQDGAHKRRRISPNEHDADSGYPSHLRADQIDFMSGAVGSASSASTTSSIFSHPSHGTMSSAHGHSLYSQNQTPPTVHDSSPANHGQSPKSQVFPSSRHERDGQSVPAAHTPNNASALGKANGSAGPRPSARPGPGEIKGQKIAYDPELDPKHKKLPREQRISARWRSFGQNVCQSLPPITS